MSAQPIISEAKAQLIAAEDHPTAWRLSHVTAQPRGDGNPGGHQKQCTSASECSSKARMQQSIHLEVVKLLQAPGQSS